MRSLVIRLEYDAAEKKAKLVEVSEPATAEVVVEEAPAAEEAVPAVEE
jgi:hypothetical protein